MRFPSIALGALLTVLPVMTSAARHGFPSNHSEPDTTPASPVHSVRDDKLRISRVTLATGVSLEVAEQGDRNGQPVLFLHGYTDSRHSFDLVLPHVPSSIRAIVPTHRGHGNSERPACCYGTADLAADAAALLDALGVQQATIVGHSLGSFVAQRLAADFPTRVSRLVLIGSGVTPRVAPVLEFAEAVKTLSDPLPPGFARDFQQATISAPVPADFFAQAVAESNKVPARVWRDVLGALLSETPVDLATLKAPTLIVWGDKDAFWTHDQQLQLRQRIAGSRLATYPNVGHAPHWEQPVQLMRDVLAFLRESPTTPSSQHAQGIHTGHGTHTSHTEHNASAPATAAPSTVMPLLEGLGSWHLRVSTRVPDAQRFFDQGLRLVYAFNHDAAVRSFERAIALDSACAMCYWGLAYALGPNINLPMDPAAEPRALTAAQAAYARRQSATPTERALIDAMHLRYGTPAAATRSARDSAFANAMRVAARRFPVAADVQVVFADAMLNLRPWNQWTRQGEAQPGTLELVAALDRVVKRVPTHAGACHLYVHAVEASNTPERALPCAERLPLLMPGAGHVVHMPAHIYLRVGRYEDAARANITAVDADHRYLSGNDVPAGMYPMFYAPHNLHFLWASYLLSGQRAKALDAARTLVERVRIEDARAVASLEGFLIAEPLTYVRFGEWDRVLAAPAPSADLRFVRGMWHYARGMAYVAKGEWAQALASLDSVRMLANTLPADMIIMLNPAPTLLRVATEVLAGRMAQAKQLHDVAIQHFTTAVAIEDSLTYDEPPAWYHSTRNLLGDALISAGRAAAAQQAFEKDLRFLRETGWSLAGLKHALELQGKTAEAAAVQRRLEAAWKHADGTPQRGR